jgi:hypothetical protein
MDIWTEILSRQPERILAAYQQLIREEQDYALAHLARMTTEPDWHPEQVRSAQMALDALKNEPEA